MIRFAVVGLCGLLATMVEAAVPQGEPPPGIPADARALEGRPLVKIETTAEGTTTREVLDDTESIKASLKVEVVDGRFYRAGGDRRPLTLARSGEFIYLMSNEPGHYIRFTEINGTLRYVEHVDIELGSVTYWGELRFVLGRPTR